MSTNYWPVDIVSDILARLPSKSLLRFSCVSKSWFSMIIDDDSFVTKHHRHAANNNNGYILLQRHVIAYPIFSREGTERMAMGKATDNFVLCNESLAEHTRFAVAQADDEERFAIVVDNKCQSKVQMYSSILGSCNGLLCVKVKVETADQRYRIPHVYLWNPSIRKSKRVTDSNVVGWFDLPLTARQIFGFGFHPRESGNDYKVVRVVFGYKDRSSCTQVYSLRTNSWRTTEAGIDSDIVMSSCGKSTFLNGAYHWWAIGLESDKSFVMGFDFGEELFREIDLPNRYVQVFNNRTEVEKYESLWVYNDCLSVLSANKDNPLVTCHSVWMMKDYNVQASWTILFTVEVMSGLMSPPWTNKNGYILRLEELGELLLYDPKSKQAKNTGIYKVGSVAPYVESLVLLKNK